MYNILVVGAGYTGTAIARYFVQKKQRVFGLVRTSESGIRLEKAGIHSVIADLTNPDAITGLPPANFIVIAAAPGQRNEDSYRAVYLEGTKNILEVLKNKARPSLIVLLSSTGVYPDMNGAWIDEQSLFAPDSERGRILLEAERLVLSCGMPSLVFRLAGIYGPGRNRIRAVQEDAWDFPKRDSYLNMIHVDDIVEALALLFKKGEEGQVYLGVDDMPVLKSEFQRWLRQELGKQTIEKMAEMSSVGGKRCSNKKIKGLGFSFRYPDYRQGYQCLLKAMHSVTRDGSRL